MLDYTAATKPYNGIYINSLETKLSSTVNEGSVTLDDGEEIKVTYVIDRENKFAKIYIDGCLCRALYLTDSGSGVNKVYEDFSHNEKIYLNSQKGTSNSGACSIRLLRIYNRALSDDEVIQNYIASETNIDKQEKLYKFCHDISDIPALYFYGDLTNMTGDNAVNLRVKYVSPNADLYGNSFDFPSCPTTWQGTSSLQYNLKNYSIYLKDEDGVDYYYTPFENGIEEHIYTYKENYMESSNCHNLGLARFANDCLFTTKNPAQKLNNNIRNSINGFPVLLYINGEFIDIGCFNLDRYSTNSLGMDTSKFPNCMSYEINANSDTTAGAFNKWTLATGLSEDQYYKNDFRARYPLSRANGTDTFDELKRLVNWVSDASDDLFKEQIDQYFNKEYLIRYYLLVMVFQLVDSLGKNLMLSTWDGNIWYPQPYDLDTGIGLDNSGYLIYDTDCEIESGYWNTSQSQLWTKVQRVFEDDIKAEYAKLRQDKFTIDNIMKYLYNEVGSKISPVLYNHSMNTRYLQYGAQYIYACHGNRKHQIRRWIRERLIFCDTLFDYAPTTTSKSITLRCNRSGNVSLDIDTYQPMYVQVKWRNGTVQKLKVNRGETTTFTGNLATATDQEVLIYCAEYLKSIGDISYLNPSSIDIGNAYRLTYLKCNCDELLKADVSANPYLRYIDLTNCPKLGTAVGSNVLNVSGCDNLKDLYIRGTSLTSVQSNIEGGNIQNIVFPTTVQSIDLRNMYVLKSLDIPLNSALNSLTLVNCPELLTLRGDSSLDDIEIYQTLQSINFQNSLKIEDFNIIPYNLINLALRNMPSTKNITIKNDKNNSLINTSLSSCIIDECNNLTSFNINTNLTFTNTKVIDLSAAEGLEEIVCTGDIRGLDTIYIPTSIKRLIFTGNTNSIKNILVKDNLNRPEDFTGIDLTGCNNIEEFDMIALTNVKNVIGLDLTLTKNPNFNTNRSIENYIQPEGKLDLSNYDNINMNSLFKGIDFNKLEIIFPNNIEDVIDASSMFRKCTFSTEVNPDIIINIMPNIQNASYMFADCNFSADIRPTLVLDRLTNLIDASYMFSNCTGLVNFNDIEISDNINTTNMFQGIVVEEIKNLKMSHFPFTITNKIESIGNITLTEAVSVENLFKDNKVLTTVGNIDLPLVTNASHMFDSCSKLTTIGTVNIPNATDLSYMYNNCGKLITYNDVMNYPEVTNISYMYANTKINKINDLTLTDDIISINTFAGVALSEIGNINIGSILFDLSYANKIGNFNIRNITNANNLFKDNKVLTSIGNITMPLVTTASHIFDGCSNLKDIGSINMSLVKDMSYAFANTKLNYISLTNCNELTNVSYMYQGNTGLVIAGTVSFGENVLTEGLFKDCINLEVVGDININHTNVDYLFSGCNKLRLINSLTLNNVISANYMFKDCSNLVLTDINMPKVVYASHMFENCSLLTQNPLTAPLVQNVSYMFCNCIGLTSAFDVQEVFPSVTDASYIFKGCVNITSIGDFALSDTIISTGMFEGTSITRVGNVTANAFPFDSSKLISAGNITLSCDDVQDLFKDNTVLITVGDITLNNVTNASHMFDGCGSLATIGTITAPLLENVSYMFRNCVLITAMLDFTNYPNLTNVDYMYAGCTGLPKEIETLELSDTITSSTGLLDNVGITNVGTINIATVAFDLSSIQSIDTLIVRNTVDAKGLFKDNTSLTSIGTVSLPNAENISGLFKGCSNITSITSVSAPKATIAYEANYGGLFEDCSSLTTTPDITGLSNITVGDYMFKGCSGITSIDTGIFDNLNSAYKMFSGCMSLTALTDLDLSNVDNIDDIFEGCNKINKIGDYTADTMVIPVDKLITIGNLTLNEVVDASNMFKDNTKLKTIGIITMPNAIDAVSMFEGCTGLISVGANCNIEEEIYPLVLPKIDNMSRMFYGCTGLTTSIYTDNLTTVTDVSYLYAECISMTTVINLVFPNCTNSEGIINNVNITTIGDIDLDLCDFTFKYCTSIGNVTIRNIEDASRMFYGCNKLTTIGNVNLPIAKDCNNMFNSCSNLATMGELNIPLLEDGSYMFASCVKFSEVPDLSGFTNLTNASYMFRNCTGLGPIIGDVILPNVQTVTGMFAGIAVTQVGNIDLVEMPFDIKALVSIGNIRLTLTNASYMFRGCTTLTTVGDIDFPNVTTANYLFGGCTALTTVGSISMEKVVSANYMFNGCSSLNCLINLSNFPELKDASYMFNGCTSFPSVIGDVILPKVENVKEMFTGISLTEIGNIDLPSFLFDSSKLTKIGNMKLRTVTNANNLFINRINLISVGNIDLPVATVAVGMFQNCTSLVSVGYIHAPKCESFANIFNGCKELQQSYFPYSEVENSVAYAYNMQLGSKLTNVIFEYDEYNITSASSLFASCNELTKIKLPHIPKCNSLIQAFEECSGLTDLIFTDDTLENLTTMEKMCLNCTNLINVKIPQNLPICVNFIDSFRNCTSLEEIIIPNDSGTENVIATRMFMKCTSLKRVIMANMLEDGELTDNESIVKLHFIKSRNICFMFFGCTSLTYIKHLEFDYIPYTYNTSSETETNALNNSYQSGYIIKSGNYAYGFMGSCGITDIDYFKYPYKYYECDASGWSLSQNYSTYKMYMIEGNIQNIKYYEAQYIQCKLNKIKTIGTMKVGSIASTTDFFLNNTNLISIDYLECAYGSDGYQFTQFKGCSNLKYINKIKTDASRFGYISSSLSETDASILNYATFGNCTSLIKIPDLSECKINAMVGTFYGCTSLEDIDLNIRLGSNMYNRLQHFRFVFTNCNNINHISKFKIELCDYNSSYFYFNASTITNSNITEITADYIEFGGQYSRLLSNNYSIIPCWNRIKRIEYLKGDFCYSNWNLDSDTKYNYAKSSSTTYKCNGLFKNYLKEIGTYEMVKSDVTYDSCRFACSTLTSIDKIILDTNVTSVYYLFYNCTTMTKMPIIEGGSPDGVDMSYAFARSSLIEFNKDDLKIKINKADGLFAYCTTIPEVELPDLPETTSMIYAFEGCTGLTSLILNNIENVTDLLCLCRYCTSLYNITFNDTNLAKVESIAYAFYNCSSLINIDLPDFSVLKYMTRTFYGCSNLSNISNFYFDAQEYPYTFYGCSSLIEFTFEDMLNATTTEHMFENCSSLTKVTMPNNMPNVLSMYAMFGSTDIFEFVFPTKCPKLTNMQGFMNSNKDLVSFIVTEDADLSSVVNMRALLNVCSVLETVDLGTTTENVTDAFLMFGSCNNLISIKNLVIPKVICTDSDGIISSSVNTSKEITIDNMSIANFDYVVNSGSNNSGTRLIINNLIITGTDDQITFANHTSNSKIGRWHIKKIGTITFTECTRLRGYFYSCTNLISIEEFNAPNVIGHFSDATNYYGLFESCYNLDHILKLNIPNCNDLVRLFKNCNQLKNSGFSIPSTASTINYIYYNCRNLTNINIPEEMPNLANMSYAFYNCYNANKDEGLIVPITTTKLTNMTAAYCSDDSSKPVIIKEFVNDYTGYNINAQSMCTNSKILGRCAPKLPSHFYTSASYSSSMLNCAYIDDLDLDQTISYSGAIMDYRYLKNCRRISNYVNSIYYNSSSSSNSNLFFDQSTILEEIGTLKFTSSNFTGTCAGFFYNCANLKSIDYFEITNAVYGYYSYNNYGLFSQCISLERIGTIRLPALQYANYMFLNCIKLKILDELYIPKATYIGNLFYNTGFETLDLTNYTFSSSISCSMSFANMKSIKNIIGLSNLIKNKPFTVSDLFNSSGYTYTDDDGIEKNSLILDFENSEIRCNTSTSTFIYGNTFAYSIKNMIYNSKSTSSIYYLMLRNITEIENIIIYGNRVAIYVISQNLTYESIKNLLNGLRGNDGTTNTTATLATLYFSQRNYDMLTDDDKLIATNLGWSITTTTT